MPSDKILVCGFIGLGRQGAPIAHRMLEAGYPMVLWARRETTLDSFRDTAALIADSITDLAQRADHVGICVVGDHVVSEICEQLIAHMHPGGTIAIHSTVLPETCRKLADQARVRHLGLIDAPVSGGPAAATRGKLTVMTGGDPITITTAYPVLQTFAERIVHFGEVGTGQIAKLINNSLMVANMGLLHSVVQAGVEHGLDKAMLLELLQASSGRSFALDVYRRNPDMGKFDSLDTLIDKVEMLGTICGSEHEAYTLVRRACDALKR